MLLKATTKWKKKTQTKTQQQNETNEKNSNTEFDSYANVCRNLEAYLDNLAEVFLNIRTLAIMYTV